MIQSASNGGNLLNPRQLKFCNEYLKSGNATEAYKLAGYSNLSEDATRTKAARLLTNANVKAFLASFREEKQKETEIDFDWITNQYKEAVQIAGEEMRLTRKSRMIEVFGNSVDKLAKHLGFEAPTKIEGGLEVILKVIK